MILELCVIYYGILNSLAVAFRERLFFVLLYLSIDEYAYYNRVLF